MSKLLYLSFFLLILTNACNRKSVSSPSEGTIKYRISYPTDMVQSGFSTFLPSQMKVIFRQNDFKFKLKGEFSIYNLEFISRSNGDTCFTLFKIFDKKLYQKMNKKEALFLYSELGKPTIKYDKNSTKSIAGHLCKRATLHYPESDKAEVDIWYCESIIIPGANNNTPFEKVPGTLLEFTISYQNLKLHLIADEINYAPISQQNFEIPSGYEKANSNEIKELVVTLLQ